MITNCYMQPVGVNSNTSLGYFGPGCSYIRMFSCLMVSYVPQLVDTLQFGVSDFSDFLLKFEANAEQLTSLNLH